MKKQYSLLEKILIGVVGLGIVGGGGTFGVTQLLDVLKSPTVLLENGVVDIAEDAVDAVENNPKTKYNARLVSVGETYLLVLSWTTVDTEEVERLIVKSELSDILVFEDGRQVLQVGVAGVENLLAQGVTVSVQDAETIVLVAEFLSVVKPDIEME